jgi:hypothetical protein
VAAGDAVEVGDAMAAGDATAADVGLAAHRVAPTKIAPPRASRNHTRFIESSPRIVPSRRSVIVEEVGGRVNSLLAFFQ